MADLVNEIIAPEALAQLKQAREELKGAASDVTELAKLGKGITFNFKGIDNIKDLTAAVKTAEEAQDRIAKGNEKYIASVNKKNTAEEKAFQAMLRRDDAERARGQKALDDQIKRQEKLQQIAEKTTKQREIEIAREAKAMDKLNNAYEQLKVKYKQAADEAKRLGAEFGVNDARAKNAAASAMQMHKSLLAVELSVGQAQRQVGKYNMVAHEMSQVLRELPNFALGARTGILALSNNIPMLAESIKKLVETNKELKATGAATTPVWKTLMSSITSPVGLITLATAGLTFLATSTDVFKSKAKEASDATKEFEDSLKSLNATINHLNKDISLGIDTESSKARLLLGVYNDSRTTLIGRINTYQELQSMFPKVLSDLTDEEKATGVLNLAHIKQIATLRDVIEAKTKLDKIDGAITVAQKARADARSEMYAAELKMSDATKRAVDRAIKSQKEGMSHVTVADIAAGVDNSAANKYLDIRDQLLNTEGKITALEKIKYEYAIKYANIQTNIDGNKKGNKKEDILKGDQELLKAQFEYEKQRIEIDRDNQKEIVDNTQKSLEERLDANMKYQAALLALAAIERDTIVKIEQEKIDELERKKAGQSEIQKKNIEKSQDAAVVRKLAAEESYNQKSNKITIDGQKASLDIVKTSNEEWIKSEREALEVKMQLEIASYLVEEQLLEDALSKKQITRKQYNKRLSDLQRKEKISFLLAEIEYDKKILENQTLTDKQRLDATKKLNNDQEALFKARKGVGSTKVSGRITDGLAKLFNPDAEEQYLQEFYNKTIELANNAANAIIDAQNRQYENERRQLDEQSAQIRINAKQKEDVINATVRNDIERQNQLSKLAAQTAAQENEIEAKKREVARRQAEFQKKASIAAIIQNTAVAIAGALKYGVAAPPIIALIAASGAVQLAAASNTAIPAYKDGTLNHTGGAFFAGDGGERERIITPYGKSYWSNSTTTQYNEPKGTMVIPESVLKFAPPVTNNHTDIQRMYEFKTASDNKKLLQMVTSVVAEEFHSVGKGLAGAIYDTAPKDIDIRQLATEMRRAQTHQGK